jgi:peptidoglycan/LPS O-acetylase OafA/YrhL
MESPISRNPTIAAHAPEGSAPRHWPHLDALRGIAALLVVLHHAHYECPPVGRWSWLFGWMHEGHFLVTFFIILSGYCLTLPTLGSGRLRDGFVPYIKRRAWRLLPAYYAALVGSLILIATVIGQPTGRHWDFALPVTTRSVVTHFLMVHNYEFADLFKINHVFWSIAVEWQVYFAFPLLLWLGRKVGVWWTSALAVGLGMLGYYALIGSFHFGLTPHYYGMFALGMLAAHLAHSPKWEPAAEDVSWWTLAALALVATLAIGRTSSYEVLDLTFGVACVALLVATSKPGRVRESLEGRRLVALGGFSYSVYLVHAPLQHLIVERVFGPIKLAPAFEFPMMVLVGTPVILGFAYLFHRAFERPFLPGRKPGAVPAPMGLTADRVPASSSRQG